MPHTRRNPPVRLPHPDPITSDPSQRLLSDHLSDLHFIGSSRTRTRHGLAEPEAAAWELTSAGDRSSGSGFGGSLFSGGTTVASGTTGTTEEEVGPAAARRRRGEEEGEKWARRARENYYLQLTLATRVTWQAFLAEDRAGVLRQLQGAQPEVGGPPDDSGTASYRLWVISSFLSKSLVLLFKFMLVNLLNLGS